MESEGYAYFTAENNGTPCPCDYIDHQPNVRETPNLTVTAVKYAVCAECTCILQQTWVKMHVFHPFSTAFLHQLGLHNPTPGPVLGGGGSFRQLSQSSSS